MTKVYCAGVILGVTLAAAVWLYTYRVWSLLEWIDASGRHFHPSERVRLQPWWGVPATVGALLIGGGISLWLLPQGRDLIRRFADHFANGKRSPVKVEPARSGLTKL